MRRLFGGCAAVVLLVGCGRLGGPALPPTGDRLYVGIGSGLAVVDADAGKVLFSAPLGLPSADYSTLFALNSKTALGVLDGGSGAPRRELTALPGLGPSAVSTSGKRVALSEPRPGAWLPRARARTRIEVLDPSGITPPRTFDLAGNFEPEAFSADDSRLFVLEYAPPTAPDHYRVRQMSLADGSVGPLVDRFKLVVIPGWNEEEMRGVGRQQVLSPDHSMLYTLYVQDGSAFVHALNLVQGWAYCVDLPLPYGAGPAAAHAMAVAPDGKHIYVVDRGGGGVLNIDAVRLEIVQNVKGAPDPLAAHGSASAVVSPDGSALYAASGSELLVMDVASLKITHQWPLAGTPRGLGLSPDGRRAYLALDNRVAVLDSTTGRELRTLAVADVQSVRKVTSKTS